MKYWAYVNNEILGPFEKGKLLELPSFSPSLLVCPQTPVGEKTEDWKEASTYPELSALIGQGTLAPAAAFPETAPAARVKETAIPATEPPNPLFTEAPSLSFKPLTTAQPVEPIPPTERLPGMTNIAVNRLGKAGAEPAVAQPYQAAAAAEGITLDPQVALSQPAGKLSPVMPEAEPAPAPVTETFSRPAAAASPAVADMAGLENLVQRLDALSKAAATRQDINSAIDTLRFQLDQMGEVISSIKNSQFQREIMDKLVYLENAVDELKAACRNPQQAPANDQKMEMEKISSTVFGVQPVKQAEKPKTEAAKETAKSVEIADTGSKSSKIGPTLKKVFRFILTLVLLAAVLLGTVIGLKNFGVFDATKFIPFPLPFVVAPPAQPQQSATAAEQASVAIQEQVQLAAAQPAPVQQGDVTPEIIYLARTFKLKPGGLSLENKIYEHAGKAGGNFNRTGWEVRPATEGIFEITAIIPTKTDNLTYTFLVDRAKKTVLPSNDAGKAAFDALAGEAESKPPRKASKKKAGVKQTPRPQAKKAAPKKQAAPEEEYEYVEED
ncbi:MAG: hypothetical protein AAB359_03535, partial [Elusimicrobiota bacterium]